MATTERRQKKKARIVKGETTLFEKRRAIKKGRRVLNTYIVRIKEAG